MRKKGKLLILFVVIIFAIYSLGFIPAQAFSWYDPVSLVRQVADTVVSRVSDIVYYLIMQKEYLFGGFKDPNSYPTLKIPQEVEQLSSTTEIINSTSTQPIPVTTSTVSGLKKINPAPDQPLPQTIIAPTPMMVLNPTPVSAIPPAGEEITYENNTQILLYTNKERVKAGLGKLSADSLLDQIADSRADDLFANQYFEHESPDGKSVSDLAEKVNYDYLLIGENLALGNFGGEAEIVSAWMDSPGHRANILNEKYTRLGAAVKRGLFDGENSTIAVQVFAKPMTACPKPNSNVKNLIDTSSASIKQMQADAAAMFVNLNTIKNSPGLDKGYYYQKVQEYNYFAQKVNSAVLALKSMIDTYNIEVGIYNGCIGNQ